RVRPGAKRLDEPVARVEAVRLHCNPVAELVPLRLLHDHVAAAVLHDGAEIVIGLQPARVDARVAFADIRRPALLDELAQVPAVAIDGPKSVTPSQAQRLA